MFCSAHHIFPISSFLGLTTNHFLVFQQLIIEGEFEAKHGGHKVHVIQGGETFGVTSLLLKRPHS